MASLHVYSFICFPEYHENVLFLNKCLNFCVVYGDGWETHEIEDNAELFQKSTDGFFF